MEKGTPGKILVWCAIIGAIGTLAAALINGWFQHGNSAQTKPESPAPIVQTEPTTTPFTGIVTREDGTPVVHARVQASLDQQIPQSSLTDADGEFHFEVPRDSKVMHITV
jgi:flagellar basal body-associated protein FliL